MIKKHDARLIFDYKLLVGPLIKLVQNSEMAFFLVSPENQAMLTSLNMFAFTRIITVEDFQKSET